MPGINVAGGGFQTAHYLNVEIEAKMAMNKNTLLSSCSWPPYGLPASE
jgi:hypothetical protein